MGLQEEQEPITAQAVEQRLLLTGEGQGHGTQVEFCSRYLVGC